MILREVPDHVYGPKRVSSRENARARHLRSVPSRRLFKYDGRIVCPLESVQCTATANSGGRCKRRVVFGVDKCWNHTIRDYKVRVVRDQRLRGKRLGRGLEAAGDLPKGHRIPYFGQLRRATEFNKAYPEDATAPYAIMVTDTMSLDAACLRSIGALVNHSNRASDINCKITLNPGNKRTDRIARADLLLTRAVKKGTPLFWNYNANNADGSKRGFRDRYIFDGRHMTT